MQVGIWSELSRRETVSRAKRVHASQYDLGIRYLSEGNYEEAIIAFSAAIKIDPKQASAYIARGDAYVMAVQPNDIDGELASDASSAYQNALEDYLYAISLDGQIVEGYQRATEIYILLNDTDAAAELLRQGIDVTGSAVLQEDLDKLQVEEILTVLTRVTYCADDGTRLEQHFLYNEQGYNVWGKAVTFSSDGAETVRDETICTYDETETGYCHYEISRWSLYGAPRENESGERQVGPGVPVHYIAGYGTGESAGVDGSQILSKKKLAKIKANNGIYEPNLYMDPNDARAWHHTVHTFDDAGNPATITSYRVDGSITGTAEYEWTTMKIVP